MNEVDAGCEQEAEESKRRPFFVFSNFEPPEESRR